MLIHVDTEKMKISAKPFVPVTVMRMCIQSLRTEPLQGCGVSSSYNLFIRTLPLAQHRHWKAGTTALTGGGARKQDGFHTFDAVAYIHDDSYSKLK